MALVPVDAALALVEVDRVPGQVPVHDGVAEVVEVDTTPRSCGRVFLCSAVDGVADEERPLSRPLPASDGPGAPMAPTQRRSDGLVSRARHE